MQNKYVNSFLAASKCKHKSRWLNRISWPLSMPSYHTNTTHHPVPAVTQPYCYHPIPHPPFNNMQTRLEAINSSKSQIEHI
jgi:hypothetical protein